MRRSSRAASIFHACSPEIRAVTFDVGGTLIECWPSVGHIYAKTAAEHGFPGVSPSELNRKFTAAWRQLHDFRHTRAQWAVLVDATFGRLVRPPPSETFFPALYRRFAEAEAWQVFADVRPALRALRQRRLKLGIISNWDERLRPLLESLKLADCFEAITISCEADAPKPAPAIFRKAARALHLPPANILHVGDSLESDVHGARTAGFQALWLRRDRKNSRPGEIGSLCEL